jgi:hypothetical protein
MHGHINVITVVMLHIVVVVVVVVAAADFVFDENLFTVQTPSMLN